MTVADIVDKTTRSRIMASVRAKGSKGENELRRRLFAQGFRFRLHAKNLPGKPDVVFRKYSAVIFVNGCFWHFHGCHRSKLPATRPSWWKKKLERNRARDREVVGKLRELGWRVLIVWECSFRKSGINRFQAWEKIAKITGDFLRSELPFKEISAAPARPEKL